MPPSTQNLGIVSALFVGQTAPSNTKMLWYNTSPGEFRHYYYDIASSSWILLTSTGSAGTVYWGTIGGLVANQTDLISYLDTNYINENQSAGGDLSGTYPSPTVAKLNGQLPSYYLDRTNHTGTQLASTISNFSTATLAVTLSGLASGTNTPITSSNSVLVAFQNLQAQITATNSTVSNKVTKGGDSGANLSIGTTTAHSLSFITGLSSNVAMSIDSNSRIGLGLSPSTGTTFSLQALAGDNAITIFDNAGYNKFSVRNDGYVNVGQPTNGLLVNYTGELTIQQLAGNGNKALVIDNNGIVSFGSIYSGTVTSVALSVPSGLSVTGSPITTSGTLAITTSLNGVIKGNGSGFSASNIDLTSEVTGILPYANGGTSFSSYSSGDLIYGLAAGGLSKLSIGTDGQALVVQNISGNLIPQWITLPGISSAALTRTNDTNVTLTLGGSPTNALLQATSLTLGWTGTLAYGRGGTSFSSYSSGDILYGLVGGGLAKLSIGTAGQFMTVVNSGGNLIPSWSSSISGYLKADGTVPLTANWPAGNYSITANSVILGSSSNTISLGSGSGGNGTITSTSDSTKGNITIGPLTINESAGRVGVNKTTGISGQIHLVPTNTSGLYINQGTDIGVSAIEISTVNKPAVTVTTNGLINGVFSTNLTTAGSYGYKVSGNGIGFFADTTDVSAELNSSTTVGNMTQTGQLQTNNTYPNLSLYRAFNLVSSFQTGTVTNSAGGTTVTGSGTSFTTLFSVGDYITIGGETQQISNVGSNTSLTTGTWTNAHSGANYSKRFDATGSLLNLVDNTAATGDFISLTKSSTAVVRFKYDGTFFYNVGTPGSGKVLTSDASGNASWSTAASGTVTSVALSMPSGFSVGGSPITSSGTLAVTTALSGVVKASAGAFTASTVSLTSEITGILPVANGGTGTSSAFTPGSIVFAGSSGIYTQDNSSLFFDDSNNRLGAGTSIPSSRIDATTTSLGTTQADTSGLSLVNTTSAAAGAQQISPGLRFRGFGWGTTASTSQSVDFRIYNLPIQASTPNGALIFESSINGAAYSSIGAMYNTGNTTFGSTAFPSLAKLGIIGSSSGTTLTSPDSAQQTVLYNTNTTNNNFFGYTWYGNDNTSTPKIFGTMAGIYTDHTASSESFAFAWLTRSSGTLAERVRLQPNGNLCIGTSTDAGTRLSVQASATDPLVKLYNVGNGSKTSIFFYADTASGGTTNSVAATIKGVYGTDNTTSATLILGTIYGEGAFLNKNNLYVGRIVDSTTAAADGNLILGNATPPAAALTNAIHIYADDSSDGSTNSTLCLYTEQTVESFTATTISNGLKIKINGTEYKLALIP